MFFSDGDFPDYEYNLLPFVYVTGLCLLQSIRLAIQIFQNTGFVYLSKKNFLLLSIVQPCLLFGQMIMTEGNEHGRYIHLRNTNKLLWFLHFA